MKSRQRATITLTTDFGLSDEYAGVLKGVIYSKAPEAHIVDLSHSIPSYDISKAAYLIASAYHYFPPRTIHLVVVDPGVGGDRDIILLQAEDHFFLGPDNGVLGLIIKNHQDVKAFKVTNSDLFLKPICPTFHGRDIFAPVAAHLASGADPGTVGAEIQPEQLEALDFPQPAIDRTKKQISGTIISIDHFGNSMSNICKSSVGEISSCPEDDSFSLAVGGNTIQPLKKTYQDAGIGEALIIYNSRNYLEIAVNQGNAAQMLQIQPDDQVLFSKV